MKVEHCTHCGAPAHPEASECGYCRAAFARETPPASAPPAPRAAATTETSALVTVVRESAPSLWDEGRAAWTRWGESGYRNLSAGQRGSADRLSAYLGTAYVGAIVLARPDRAAHDARVAALWSLAKDALDETALDEATTEWDRKLGAHDPSEIGELLAEALADDEGRYAAIELVAATIAASGARTTRGAPVLEGIAEAFELDEEEAFARVQARAAP